MNNFFNVLGEISTLEIIKINNPIFDFYEDQKYKSKLERY